MSSFTYDQLSVPLADFIKKLYSNMPASIYCKDLDGAYLGRNTYAMHDMQNMGLETETDEDFVIGKTDYDLFSLETAQQFRENDLTVIEASRTIIKEETVILANNKKLTNLSAKAPLYNEKKQIIGPVGNTINVTSLRTENPGFSLPNTKITFVHTQTSTIKLTYRETDCLKYYLRGHSAKEIGEILNISLKTVETHLANVRNKLGCSQRSQVFQTIMQNNPTWRHTLWN